MTTKRKARVRAGPKSTTEQFEALIKKTARRKRYVLKLYVTGSTARSALAVANVRSLCEEHLPGRYDLEVIDIYQQPTEAVGAQIIAAPTLLKKEPAPPRRMIGDLADRVRVLVGLDLQMPDSNLEKPKTKWVAL